MSNDDYNDPLHFILLHKTHSLQGDHKTKQNKASE